MFLADHHHAGHTAHVFRKHKLTDEARHTIGHGITLLCVSKKYYSYRLILNHNFIESIWTIIFIYISNLIFSIIIQRKLPVIKNISCNNFLVYIYSFNNKFRYFFLNLEERILSILIRAEKPKISIYKSIQRKITLETDIQHQKSRVAFLCPINLSDIYIFCNCWSQLYMNYNIKKIWTLAFVGLKYQ